MFKHCQTLLLMSQKLKILQRKLKNHLSTKYQSNFGLHFGSPQIQILVPSMLVPLLAAELTACSTRRQEGTVRHLIMEK